MVAIWDKAVVASRHYRKIGRLPNFKAPRTFNEKMQVAKLTWRSPLMPLLTDKVAVKPIIAAELGDQWVTPNYFTGPQLPPFGERNWPVPYVIKVNQQSGGNIFVHNAEKADWDWIEKRVSRWLDRPHGKKLREWAYSQVPGQVLVEPFLGNGGEPPIDYKFLVFGGRVEVVEVDTDRFVDHKTTFFDRDWQRLPFTTGPWQEDPRPLAPPKSLSEMIAAAERISTPFPFVRIDFYDIDGSPRFSEVTLYHDSGEKQFHPALWDEKLGSLWPDGLPEGQRGNS